MCVRLVCASVSANTMTFNFAAATAVLACRPNVLGFGMHLAFYPVMSHARAHMPQTV